MDNDQLISEADELVSLLRYAKGEGREYEVAASFIDEAVHRGTSIPDACQHAMREWNL